jgi:hypothetical protein
VLDRSGANTGGSFSHPGVILHREKQVYHPALDVLTWTMMCQLLTCGLQLLGNEQLILRLQQLMITEVLSRAQNRYFVTHNRYFLLVTVTR